MNPTCEQLKAITEEMEQCERSGQHVAYVPLLQWSLAARDEIERLQVLVSDACDDWETSITRADTIAWNPLESIAFFRSELKGNTSTALESISAQHSDDQILSNIEQGVRDGLAKAAESKDLVSELMAATGPQFPRSKD